MHYLCKNNEKTIIMMKMFLTLCLATLVGMTPITRATDYTKMSTLVRTACRQQLAAKAKNDNNNEHMCAFVKVEGNADSLFAKNQCTPLARFGSIYIVDMPISSIGQLSSSPAVKRIEASPSCRLAMDSTAMHVNALPAYAGQALPQAFTGKGVVMGVQDVGFDFTHPNFYSSNLSSYRIRCVWDQLAPPTAGTPMYVGASLEGADAIVAYAHTRNGIEQTHGTHTLGIAAGSGYNSVYRGMAFESDICLVSNCVTQDTIFIAPGNRYKYTSATDALGFKYIFDYARQLGRPCVISFSEGSPETFANDEELYYAVLDSLTGPGRILVASAGNTGQDRVFFSKPAVTPHRGVYLGSTERTAALSVRFKGQGAMRVLIHPQQAPADTLVATTSQVMAAANRSMVLQKTVGDADYKVEFTGFENQGDSAFDVAITGPAALGSHTRVSFELMGATAFAQAVVYAGYIDQRPVADTTFTTGRQSHTMQAPAAAPAVIAVGATSYRTQFVNYKGELRLYNQGTNGQRAPYSSVGPTLYGVVKPDVMAPGTNVVSSYNSYYIEAHPQAFDTSSDVKRFSFRGRTYSWNCNSGTSMSAPVVGGAIALWLEANPMLSPQDIRRILFHTARTVEVQDSVPGTLSGYGQIDVYRGLLHILGLNAVPALVAQGHTSAHVTPLPGRRLNVTFGSALKNSCTLRVYSPGGVLVYAHKIAQGVTDTTIACGPLASGVYAVQLCGEGVQGSTLVRW